MSTYLVRVKTGAGTFDLPFDNHQWEVVGGYVAPVQSWIGPADVVNAIVDGLKGAKGTAREATLFLGDPNTPLVVERAYVIGSCAADNPQRRYLLMADVRVYLGFAIFVIDANVRRRLGDVRVVGAGIVTSTLADTIGYSPWSIDKLTAYTWSRFKEQALIYLTTPRHGRPTIQFTTDTFSITVADQVIQETTTDSDGTAGLARAIESVPGASLYAAVDGILHVYDATPGAEAAFIAKLPKALWRHGDLQLLKMPGLRPSLWRVYMDYAIEVRFNYMPTVGDTIDLGQLENVLQVTDQSLSIPAGAWGDARTVGQGTWITLDEAFAAWGGKKFPGTTIDLPILSDDIVADHWYGDLLQRYAWGGGITAVDPIWAMRIQELMRTYRTYFRVNKDFWDQVRHFWAVRAAVWDPVTGTRAPAPVYSNFHFTQLDNFVEAGQTVYGTNVNTSMAPSGNLKDGQPSGFQVEIVDEELMVLRIDRSITRYPDHTRIVPSPTVDTALNKITITGDVARPWSCDAVYQKLQHKVKRSDVVSAGVGAAANGWLLSIIMTCSPASPNDLRRLYEVQVTIQDVAKLLGIKVPDCAGPDQEMRSHLTDARVQWPTDDGDKAAVAAVYLAFGGLDEGGIGPEDPITSFKPINLDLELKPLAQAMAAADLLAKFDHYEGTMAIPMTAAAVPIGSISKVAHRVTDNRVVSVMTASTPQGQFDATEFIKGSARSYLLKQIQKAR